MHQSQYWYALVSCISYASLAFHFIVKYKPEHCVLRHGLDANSISLAVLQDKAGAKARQGTIQVKETVQEYIAGAETVTEDHVTRDYVVVRARLMSAKSVSLLSC